MNCSIAWFKLCWSSLFVKDSSSPCPEASTKVSMCFYVCFTISLLSLPIPFIPSPPVPAFVHWIHPCLQFRDLEGNQSKKPPILEPGHPNILPMTLSEALVHREGTPDHPILRTQRFGDTSDSKELQLRAPAPTKHPVRTNLGAKFCQMIKTSMFEVGKTQKTPHVLTNSIFPSDFNWVIGSRNTFTPLGHSNPSRQWSQDHLCVPKMDLRSVGLCGWYPFRWQKPLHVWWYRGGNVTSLVLDINPSPEVAKHRI